VPPRCSHGTCSSCLAGCWCQTSARITDTDNWLLWTLDRKCRTRPSSVRDGGARCRSLRRRLAIRRVHNDWMRDPSPSAASADRLLRDRDLAKFQAETNRARKKAVFDTLAGDLPSCRFCTTLTKLKRMWMGRLCPSAAHAGIAARLIVADQ
jgi:hypothetical protein